MSIPAHSKPHHRRARDVLALSIEKSFVAFPTDSQADPAHAGPEYWDGRSAPPQHRTVRRKKSSFDLRHVFKTGGTIPNAPASSAVAIL